MHMTFDLVGAAWFALDISVRSIAAAVAVALVLSLLRVRAAGVLHAAWSAVLFTMLFMPVLPLIVPPLPVPVPPAAVDLIDAGFRSLQSSPDRVGDATSGLNIIAAVPSFRPGGSVRSDQLIASDANVRASRSWVARILLIVYLAGALLFTVRLAYGWVLAAAMIGRARRGGPLPVDAGGSVYESSEVSVPMTLGAIRPVIVLPVAWKTWDSDTLAAIVAHETAHVARRDASINSVAHINRAVFWFHPLAWWLERKVAVTAEHACDEAGARAISAPDRYAEILVEMADLVRRHGGRLACPATGVNGAGHLDRRIDRLLRGDAFAKTSRRKKMVATLGCILAIGTVIACREQPLREDPALANTLADRAEQTKRFEAARDMTQDQADALEQRVALNAEDFDARWQLVTYYRTSRNVPWDKKVAGLRRHALWLIEHRPEHDVQPPALSPQFDPEGFATARKLWEAHLARPDASAFLVYRAASFFAPHDKPYAEHLILRGMAMDPESAALKARMSPDVGGYQWPSQLASLYAAALLGSESASGTYNDVRTYNDKVTSPYVMDVRKKLELTTDAKLLARVGSILTRPIPPVKDTAVKEALEQTRALGIRYLERALQLDPKLDSAKAVLVRIRLEGQATDVDHLVAGAVEGFMRSEDITEYAKKDVAAAKTQRDEAKARAEEVLKMTEAHPRDPAYSAAIMTAHHVLATVALRDGDRGRAVQHMRESVNVPTSERIQYAPPFSWLRPVHRLLREGEREAVAEFLEAFARLTIIERDRLLTDAQAIRDGRMPTSYQYMVARERSEGLRVSGSNR
jgi:beta-lactamase regulating signal transducer with metallopeptidase domain